MRGLKRLLKLSARMTACKTSSSSSISDCLEVMGKRVIKIDRIFIFFTNDTKRKGGIIAKRTPYETKCARLKPLKLRDWLELMESFDQQSQLGKRIAKKEL